MNIENYIESHYQDLSSNNLLSNEFLNMYKTVKSDKLRQIFSSLHHQFLDNFKMMNTRLPTGEHGAHFWAQPSRDLIFCIEMVFDLIQNLKDTEFNFDLDPSYRTLFLHCQTFLSKSGGSQLPPNMKRIIPYYTAPIFTSSLVQKVEVKGWASNFEMKLIGEGSYAHIYKYHDEFYRRDFAVKRAKKSLTKKELARFKREFEEMRNLKSPYIVEVYSFDDSKSQYIMECMDKSLDAYVSSANNSLTSDKRKNLTFQILRALSYLHSKNLVHRDICPKNVLVREYDDTVVIKVSDFGLVKIPESQLTSQQTEFKGYFNDPALITEGFDNYGIPHETYALTKLIYFVLTGKINTSQISDPHLSKFVERGLDPDKSNRYQSIAEVDKAFRTFCNASRKILEATGTALSRTPTIEPKPRR